MVVRAESPVAELHPFGSEWRKSTLSGPYGCVEVIFLNGGVGVRDSKNPDGPMLVFSELEWTEFLAGIRKGEFDPVYHEMEAFYAAHYNSLRSYLAGQGYREEDVDDIVQESILILRDRWARVRTMKHPKAYWYKVATRLMWRLYQRRGAAIMPDSEDQLAGLADVLDSIALVDDYRSALSMIQRLPPRQRQVLWLRAVEGFTEAQTARIMLISLGTVKSYYHDAKACLRELLAGSRNPWREERL
jgi:RNA polymerase sigma factor (sigma-70 family)